jgi:hypothetical protein
MQVWSCCFLDVLPRCSLVSAVCFGLSLMLLASPALSATVCGGIDFPSHFAIFQKRGRATAIMATWLQKDA